MELLSIADTAVVLPPSLLTGIGRQITGDVMVGADLSATETAT